jgi:hypothetical protein
MLSRYGLWKGNDTPPPLWLVHATMFSGSLQGRPQLNTLLLRRLKDQSVPTLAQLIQTYDRTTDDGWDFLIYRFLESGGLDKAVFQERLEQFWANGYDWTQLSHFFVRRYASLNGAELGLLWKTFVGEALSSEQAICFSENDSLELINQLAKMEVLQNHKLEVLTPVTWFLYRNDPFAQERFAQKSAELEVLAISIHPYYYNACHSLSQVFTALADGELNAYRDSVLLWNQDMLDAQQLSFETDLLLKRLCL